MSAERGRYSRGFLPHFDVGSRPQFLTWRLADSVPRELIEAWRTEAATLPDSVRRKHLLSQIEKHSDLGFGACHLAKPTVARIVQEALFHDHGRRYELIAWSIMPNHVHALLTPVEGVALESIMRVLKGVTATAINRYLRQSGRLWEPDYYDRFIRDGEHFMRVRRYIEWNPVKAKLCQDPSLFPWSSAYPDARKRLEVVASGGLRVREPEAD